MIERRLRLQVIGLVTLTLLMSACSEPGLASPGPQSAASPAVPTLVAHSPEPSSEPPAIEPSLRPTSPDASAQSSDPVVVDPTLTPPPDATLQVEGGDPVVGELGSWGWNGAGNDAPYLPGYPIHVGIGERLVFTMTVPVPIESWQVQRVPPSSIPGTQGLVGMAEGTGGTIWFETPPEGTWAVSVSVLFTGTLGSASYYWSVTVE